jgi:two-component system, response regulator PdtaR
MWARSLLAVWWYPLASVLVVEDEILTSLSICADLNAAGYEVLTAPDAAKAIKILESRNDISTIFTDITMPGSMDGLALAAAVRDRWPPVNIIITTGMKRPSDDTMPARSIFIPKPYEGAEVVKAIRGFS